MEAEAALERSLVEDIHLNESATGVTAESAEDAGGNTTTETGTQ